MKNLLLFSLLIYLNNYQLFADTPPNANPLEIFLSTTNHNNQTTTFYSKAFTPVFKQSNLFPTEEYYFSNITITGNINPLLTGWDFKHPGAPDSYADVDTIGFGIYKFYSSAQNSPYFYLNYCDCRYTRESSFYPTQDLYLQYNGNENKYYFKPSGGTYIEISDGDTLNIWEALGATGQPTIDCFLSSFTPSNLSLSYVNNKPKLLWSIEHPDTLGAYKIFRFVWENGDFNGQTAVWPPVVTLNSWVDNDLRRFRFGNYTIKYEVAYLSHPTNESPKSNQVTTTTGNWSGPLGKIVNEIDDFNIYPNPFNSSVTISIKERIKTIVIYNILGETLKKYSFTDLRSSNQIIWNGIDKYGNKVPSGTYFVMLISDNEIQTRKLMYVK